MDTREAALQVLARESAQAFHHAFAIECQQPEILHAPPVPEAADIPVASLPFHGDYGGRMWMYLPAGSVQTVAARIRALHSLPDTVRSADIFSEMLNIYAARLATLFSAHGFNMLLSPPDKAVPPYPQDLSNAHILVRLPTPGGTLFSFYFVFQQGRSHVHTNG